MASGAPFGVSRVASPLRVSVEAQVDVDVLVAESAQMVVVRAEFEPSSSRVRPTWALVPPVICAGPPGLATGSRRGARNWQRRSPTRRPAWRRDVGRRAPVVWMARVGSCAGEHLLLHPWRPTDGERLAERPGQKAPSGERGGGNEATVGLQVGAQRRVADVGDESGTGRRRIAAEHPIRGHGRILERQRRNRRFPT
jgi:hypothetical protein